jgi:hypothetical protein
MARLILWAGILFTAAALQGCSGKCGLDGSECDLIDCSSTEIKCQHFDSPQHMIIIHFRRVFEDGGLEWAAKVYVDLNGLDKAEGLEVKDQACMDRLSIDRPPPGSMWPVPESCKGEISSGGDEIGKEMSGKFSFYFEDGRAVTACFSCTLEGI